ncbi:glycosyltransferase [Pedobacter africanus]|uniref:Glycosyl transferases group 1 n=1 Tax=Pedobacter africanus TaxID=151894 RepID=A0A1W2DGD5_9SPHI|nr:glycosyltransferase [Pedobacter africanus]SMC95968.1 Glycosyl transferases group 1 [Pedobacter africanus]
MPDKIKGRDIIVVGQQPWDTEIGSNCKNIALEFSKDNRVLYINSPLDRITLYRSKNDPKTQKRLEIIKGKQEGLIQIEQQLWNYYPDCMVESINWIGSTRIFDFFNRLNNVKLAKSIAKAISELNFKDFILFNDNEIFKGFYLNDFLKPAVSIYYSRDYMVAVDYWKKHGEKLEPQLIAKNDICVANSTFLAQYCQKYNPNSYYVGQGCELDIFFPEKAKDLPADLSGLKRPLIGYVGALQSIRLDIELIEYIAFARPEWTIVLVGPENEVFKNSGLHQLGNVIFTGAKAVAELPDYINAFDVCINPQLVNEVTIGNYPRKIDEYLAIGKPVVATNTKAMETFKDFVYLAASKDDYVTLIEKALKDDSEQEQHKRREFALGHTWENSVSAIYQAVIGTGK